MKITKAPRDWVEVTDEYHGGRCFIPKGTERHTIAICTDEVGTPSLYLGEWANDEKRETNPHPTELTHLLTQKDLHALFLASPYLAELLEAAEDVRDLLPDTKAVVRFTTAIAEARNQVYFGGRKPFTGNVIRYSPTSKKLEAHGLDVYVDVDIDKWVYVCEDTLWHYTENKEGKFHATVENSSYLVDTEAEIIAQLQKVYFE